MDFTATAFSGSVPNSLRPAQMLSLIHIYGTSDAKETVKKSGIVVMQYPEGVDFGDEKAYLVIGIAGVGDEHLEILGNLSLIHI